MPTTNENRIRDSLYMDYNYVRIRTMLEDIMDSTPQPTFRITSERVHKNSVSRTFNLRKQLKKIQKWILGYTDLIGYVSCPNQDCEFCDIENSFGYKYRKFKKLLKRDTFKLLGHIKRPWNSVLVRIDVLVVRRLRNAIPLFMDMILMRDFKADVMAPIVKVETSNAFVIIAKKTDGKKLRN